MEEIDRRWKRKLQMKNGAGVRVEVGMLNTDDNGNLNIGFPLG